MSSDSGGEEMSSDSGGEEMSSDSGGEERFYLEVAAVVCASLLAITNIPLLFKVIKELYPANNYVLMMNMNMMLMMNMII